MRDEQQCAGVSGQRVGQRLNRMQIQMVGRLVHHDQMRVISQSQAQQQLAQFARRRVPPARRRLGSTLSCANADNTSPRSMGVNAVSRRIASLAS